MSEERADYYIVVPHMEFGLVVAELDNHTESEARKILERFGDSATLAMVVARK
jgi:hypothetical protein